jgi:hypothetical protein
MERRTRALIRIAVLGVAAIVHNAEARLQVRDHRPHDSALLRAPGVAIETIDLAATIAAKGPLTITMALEGRAVQLDLRPVSLRSPDFQVLVDDGTGRMRVHRAPPPATYRGSVRQWPGSDVAATIVDGRLSAYIRTDAMIWGVQPLADIDRHAAPGLHVVYRSDDANRVLGPGWCAADEPGASDVDVGALLARGLKAATESPSGNRIALVAFDADVEYWQLHNGDVGLVVAGIETVLNGVNVIYEREVAISHVIPRIIVRTAEPDGMDSTHPPALLAQLRLKWQLDHSANGPFPVARDTVHLMTGKVLNGGVFGNSYLGGMCSLTTTGDDEGYGFTRSLFSTLLSNRVTMTAHELGHNWIAIHCDGDSDCGIMCSTLGGCSGVGDRFGFLSRLLIQFYRNEAICLDICPADLTDCNHNCIDDSQETDGTDCNDNGILDECDLVAGINRDCNLNGVLDECEEPTNDEDCNGNGVADECDLLAGPSVDCDGNGVLDVCGDLTAESDCNGNGVMDACDFINDPGRDCNGNGVLDECETLDAESDCNDNGAVDECEILTDSGSDCDGNGVLDECEALTAENDCNDNGVLDVCDLAAGVSSDCNGNGVSDDCEDCNGNGLADECDVDPMFDVSSPVISPFGASFPGEFTIEAPPRALSDVTVTVTAFGDFDGSTERIDVLLNDTLMAQLFSTAAVPGHRCPETPDVQSFTIPSSQYEVLLRRGDATFRLVPFLAEPDLCDDPTFAMIRVHYAMSVLIDLNGNGIIDVCECTADCAGAGRDTLVSVQDLLTLLAQWGSPPDGGGSCDIAPASGDGIVDANDLLALLAAWGTCAP